MTNFYAYEVHRAGEVEAHNTKKVEKFIHTLSAVGKPAKLNAIFMFGGYDDDNRELYEIQEVRDFVAKVFKKVPHLFYFIDQKHHENQQLLLTCLCDIAVFYQGEKLSPIEMEERGYTIETLPKSKIRISMPNKMWNNIKAELRKYARSIDDKKGAEEIITQMKNLYGVD